MTGLGTDPALQARREYALRQANRIRRRARDAKRELRAGTVTLVDLVDDPLLANLAVLPFLTALPAVRNIKATRALVACNVPATRPLGEMSHETAERLLRALGKEVA